MSNSDGKLHFKGVFKNCIKYLYLSKKKNILYYILLLFVLIAIGYFIILIPDTLIILDKFIYILMGVLGAVLGFLIAGFALFVSMGDRDLTYLLQLYKNNKTKLSQFETNLIYFFEPFIIIGFTLIISILLYLAVLVLSPLLPLTNLKYKELYSLIIGGYFFLIFISAISIKDFMINIYNIALSKGEVELMLRNSKKDIKEIAKDLLESNREPEHK
jgi:hypothetical protein